MEVTHPFKEPINHQSNLHEEYLILRVALAMGMRFSEVMSLTWKPAQSLQHPTSPSNGPHGGIGS